MQKDNFLEYIFAIKKGLSWTQNEDGLVTVAMQNKGVVNRIAQRFFDKPAVSYIDLPGLGSFVFSCIDSQRTVLQIGRWCTTGLAKMQSPCTNA